MAWRDAVPEDFGGSVTSSMCISSIRAEVNKLKVALEFSKKEHDRIKRDWERYENGQRALDPWKEYGMLNPLGYFNGTIPKLTRTIARYEQRLRDQKTRN